MVCQHARSAKRTSVTSGTKIGAEVAQSQSADQLCYLLV
jgi:hypothetical protein